MTEAEWLAGDDVGAMLEIALHDGEVHGRRYSDRKLRLFACACYWPHLGSYAPDMALDLRKLEEAADGSGAGPDWPNHGDPAVYPRDALAWCEAYHPGHGATQAALLREVCGSPWRPVLVTGSAWVAEHERLRPGKGEPRKSVVLRSWLTPTVLELAQTAYSERLHGWQLDPARLGVLADALEDAGSTDEAILRHLRGEERCPKCLGVPLAPTNYQTEKGRIHLVCQSCKDTPGWAPLRSPHVRGCWCIDLILGKS